jgi:hypothetical protein
METRRNTALDTVARFKMKQAGTVSIAYEDRVTPKPAWLAAGGFQATNLTMSVRDVSDVERTFTIYQRQFQSGAVVPLGRNSNDGTGTSMMYLVALTPTPTMSVLAERAKITSNALKAVRVGNGIRIDYAVKDRGSVRMDLFDVKGNRVRTLVNTSKDAGAYREYLSTDGLAAGMYMVRLNAGTQVLRERVLIAR